MAQELRIITTGGTFDKQYDAIKGELTFRESQLPRILQQARCTLTVQLEGPLAIDSLYMTEEQRQEVASSCLASNEERIVVVHGTDTMCKTAAVVAESLGKEDRHVIIFTGAMIPYSLENSDAVFNLGCAITAVQILTPGVYICMSGKIFTWNNCIKNKEKGIFQNL
ncbi:asparaginase domain-containing protein [uncultured Sphaerochaeta sp.]|uniref:asparaginase domain-containing protein n=1 Tax=uncultured Sphaerochaeta sp. TaxID=886478 RepID=UPI002A0A22A3|nr:asparaginase domain-containing protein [uncultured Sphaerochaeta sp.]